MTNLLALQWATIALVIANALRAAATIGCFICVSNVTWNANQPEPGPNPCEDPFSTISSSQLITDTTVNTSSEQPPVSYQSPCWGYRSQQAQGLFPADHCIKINGRREYQGGKLNQDTMIEQIYIRTCGLDAGSTTSDTEIVRMSHCGKLKLGDNEYNGCVQSCDSDGCNSSRQIYENVSSVILMSAALIIVFSRLDIF